MTAEDKVKEADNMRNSPPPGTIDPATGQPTGASPDALKVPGKSSH